MASPPPLPSPRRRTHELSISSQRGSGGMTGGCGGRAGSRQEGLVVGGRPVGLRSPPLLPETSQDRAMPLQVRAAVPSGGDIHPCGCWQVPGEGGA